MARDAHEVINVLLCPFCEDEGVVSYGHKDWRVLVGGRSIIVCDTNTSHRWQDADEEPHFSDKDLVLRR